MHLTDNMFELRIREIIAQILGITVEEVNDDADILDDLGADSIQVLELIVAIENEFNIQISDEEVIKHRTVGEIVEFVLAKN